MEFNSGLNVIMGENDAGKTSLIDSLKILFSKKKIDINDFNEIENPVTIELGILTSSILWNLKSAKRISLIHIKSNLP